MNIDTGGSDSGQDMVVQEDTIFVSGMSPETTEDDITNHFGAIGIIKVRSTCDWFDYSMYSYCFHFFNRKIKRQESQRFGCTETKRLEIRRVKQQLLMMIRMPRNRLFHGSIARTSMDPQFTFRWHNVPIVGRREAEEAVEEEASEAVVVVDLVADHPEMVEVAVVSVVVIKILEAEAMIVAVHRAIQVISDIFWNNAIEYTFCRQLSTSLANECLANALLSAKSVSCNPIML